MRKKLITFLSIMLIPMFLGGCFNKDNDTDKENTTSQEEISDGDSLDEDEASTDENDKVTEDNNTNEETNASNNNNDDNKDNNNANNSANNNSSNNNTNSGSNSNDNKDDIKEEIVKEKMTLRIFYHDLNYNMYYVDKEVEVTDKAIVKAVTEAIKGGYNSEIISNIPSTLEVRSAEIKNGILTVDFGKGAFDSVSLGSGLESCMIQGLVNSYGYNLGVDKVIIKIDGKNYATGHMLLEDGDYFEVDYKDIKELK